jgi:hypothetical protein
LQYRAEHEISIGRLFQEFQGWWNTSGAPSSAEALKEMQRNAAAFASWLEPDGTDRPAQFSRVLKALDTSTVFPLLFFLFVEAVERIPERELTGIVDDLESFLIRRAVCRLTNKQYNRFFLGLLRHLRETDSITRATVRERLAAGTGDSVRWPGDEEFGRAFLHRPIYKELKREVTLILLNALEQALLTAKHERFEIVGKLSIEHIMPQAWEKERAWALYDDTDEARASRYRMLHSAGNLTLVTPAFNTSLSNRAFDRKQREFKRIARLLLNRTFEEASSWDEKAILRRGRELFDLARKRWPHPGSPQTIDHLSLDHVPPPTSVGDGDGEPYEPPVDIDSARKFISDFAECRRQRIAEGAANNV